jgi:hypothetical protein
MPELENPASGKKSVVGKLFLTPLLWRSWEKLPKKKDGSTPILFI